MELFRNNSVKSTRDQQSRLAWVVDHHRVYDRGDTEIHHGNTMGRGIKIKSVVLNIPGCLRACVVQGGEVGSKKAPKF